MILAISEFGGNCDILVMKVLFVLKLIIDSFVFQVDSSHEIRATSAPSVIRSSIIRHFFRNHQSHHHQHPFHDDLRIH